MKSTLFTLMLVTAATVALVPSAHGEEIVEACTPDTGAELCVRVGPGVCVIGTMGLSMAWVCVDRNGASQCIGGDCDRP